MTAVALRTLTILSLLVFCGMSWSANYVVDARLHSDFGSVQVVKSVYADGTNGPPSTILLKGREIFRATPYEPYLQLHGIYRITDGQALLISQNCGGSGCRVNQLSFILLRQGSTPAVVTNDDFNSETNVIDAKDRSGKVTVNLGYFRQKRKVAILDSGRLSIVLMDEPNQTLTNDLCMTLYEATDACIREHSLSSGCTSYAEADFSSGGFVGSNAEVWAVRSVSHYPGFNRDGFVEACGFACKSGTLVPYEVFRSQACENRTPTYHSTAPVLRSPASR
jgi:hypothetical protein